MFTEMFILIWLCSECVSNFGQTFNEKKKKKKKKKDSLTLYVFLFYNKLKDLIESP